MKERTSFWRTIIPVFAVGALVYELSQFAFTKKQRDSLVERDENHCQVKGVIPHKCEDNKDLHVHHIVPQRYSSMVGIENPDFPENGITICRNAHETIHPDMHKARMSFHENKDSFNEMFDERKAKLEGKTIYWNDKWDRLLHVLAIKNTQNAKKKGWNFPEKQIRNKN